MVQIDLHIELCQDSISLYRPLSIWPFGLSHPVKYFTDRSKAVLLLWIFYVVFFCHVFAMPFCLCVPCGHLLGKG